MRMYSGFPAYRQQARPVGPNGTSTGNSPPASFRLRPL